MWTFISVSLALVINFYSPEISENNKSIKNNYAKNKIIKGFPYQYFKGEVLTDEMVEFRIRVIYISFMISITVTFSVSPMVSPIVGQATFSSTPTFIERLSSSQSPNSNFDNQTIHERVINDRDVNSFEDNDRQVILAKAEGNPITPPTNRGPSSFPTAPSGGRPSRSVTTPYVNPFRRAPKLAPGPGAGANPAGAGNGDNAPEWNDQYPVNTKSSDQCQNPNSFTQAQKKKKKKNSRQVSKKRVIEAYQDFMSKMKKKGYEVNISEDRFLELSTNPQTGQYDEKSIFETEGGLKLEANGTVNNLRRPDNPKVDLDFVAEHVGSGETIFIDHKGMIDFGSLSDKGIDISGFPSHESVAFNMGKDSVDQKGKFIGMDQGPASMGEVVHLYNFENIRNRAETPLLMQAVLNGAEQAGYMDGIIFLNYE